jgi:Xaa-Pro aminopeptidase
MQMRGQYSTFARSEYEGRLARARVLMEAAELDALFITAEANYCYFTGHRTHSPWSTFTRPHVAIVTRDGSPRMIVHAFTRPEAASRSHIFDICEYGSLVQDAVPEMVQALKEMGLSRGRIGCELGYEQRLGISLRAWEQVVSALPDAEFVDAADLLWKLRMKKSPAEIECLRQAARATSEAFEACYARIREGATEVDVASAMGVAMLNAGAESPGFNIICSGRDDYQRISARPTDRRLKKGDMVWVDASAVSNGYWSDFCRAAVVGGPSAEQVRLQRIVTEATMAAIQVIRPGTSVKLVAETCARKLAEHGFSLTFDAGRCGHGLGLMSTEPPHVASYDHSILEEGMVITVEPGIVNEHGVFCVEENVAVTADGFDVLSGASREIYTV